MSDGESVSAAQWKTAAQKCLQLNRMSGIIAQFAPSLLCNDVIKQSTNVAWISQHIRKHYSFRQSEINFSKLSTIRHNEGERYETLCQRIIAHLEDNLLTVESDLIHDGVQATEHEEMSSTTEYLAVYLWLMLIDECLPAYISRVYAHDLQTKSLKEIQPQIVEAMDSLLMEIPSQEDIQVQYSCSSNPKSWDRQKQKQRKWTSPSNLSKVCILCKSAGRNFQGHDISSCWFISKFDKIKIAKAFHVEVDHDHLEEEDEFDFVSYQDVHATESNSDNSKSESSVIKQVQSCIYPYFYAFYQHHPCKIVVDSGATSSLENYENCKHSN